MDIAGSDGLTDLFSQQKYQHMKAFTYKRSGPYCCEG